MEPAKRHQIAFSLRKSTIFSAFSRQISWRNSDLDVKLTSAFAVSNFPSDGYCVTVIVGLEFLKLSRAMSRTTHKSEKITAYL